jgi:hypothetical protein
MAVLQRVHQGRDPRDTARRHRQQRCIERRSNKVQVVPLTSNVDRLYSSEAYVEVTGKRHKAMADQIARASKRRLQEMYVVPVPSRSPPGRGGEPPTPPQGTP